VEPTKVITAALHKQHCYGKQNAVDMLRFISRVKKRECMNVVKTSKLML